MGFPADDRVTAPSSTLADHDALQELEAPTAVKDSMPAGYWTLEIHPRRSLLQIPIADIWRYRDLLFLLVHRDFVTFYKQTILGPLWFFIQPLLTALMFTLVFGNIAGLSTDGLPMIVFYLAGITCWGYFSECLNKTATVFVDNANLFGKVYFPRMITPLSIVVSNLMRLGIQLGLFLAVAGYYMAQGLVHPKPTVLLLPVLVLLMAGIGLGLGLIFSSLTTKYRDLRFLLSFGVQLLMYVTPVIYPASAIPSKYAWIVALNPLTAIIETFRHGWLGQGDFSLAGLLYSAVCSLAVLVAGTVIFNRVESTFIDTV